MKKGISAGLLVIAAIISILGIGLVGLQTVQQERPSETEKKPMAEELPVPAHEKPESIETSEPEPESIQEKEFGHQVITPVITFRQNPEIPSDGERQQLPDCNNKLFSITPVDLQKVTQITPLGNLAPPGHTFPTEHVYFHITPGGTTTDTIQLSAPSDAHIILISFDHGITQDPVDYTIYFSLCKDVVGYYNHVKELSAGLEKIVNDNQCEFQGESKDKRCNIETLTPIKAGANMGGVGRLQGNFDFGAIDLRKAHKFANPSRYGNRSFHIQCAFDYYDAGTRDKLYSLLSRKDGKCGTTAQDVSGALKGNWFFSDARADMGSDWDKYLAFVQDNEEPAVSVISIGGVFTDAGKFEFMPQASGLVNREFTQVTSDGSVYCYESDSASGHVILQLVGDKEMKIERQEGKCSGYYSFNKPVVYNR